MAQGIDYEAALRDPAACFGSPAAIVAANELSDRQKIALLRQWAYDESELAVATEEGMPGGESQLFQEIAAALATLDRGGDSAAPTKQRLPSTR